MNDKRYDLLALGDPCVDIVLRAERLPLWDDKCVGESLGLFGGGTEANVACAAAGLGWRSALFGRIGDDLHGDFILRDLQRHGVHTGLLQRAPGVRSSMAIVAVSTQGERSVIWLPPGDAAGSRADQPDGAQHDARHEARQDTRHDTRHDARDTERLDALAASRWVYTMPYAASALPLLAAQAAANGTRIAIDVEREGARRSAGIAALLADCDVAFFNRGGFEAAAGQPPSTALLHTLCRSARARSVVVTLGADGAMAADRDDGVAHVPAAPVPRVVDATGAGDCFNATWLVARDVGLPLAAALAQAARAAAQVVSRLGARSGLARSR